MGEFTFIEAAVSGSLAMIFFLLTPGSLLNTCLESIFGPCEDCGFPSKPGKGDSKATALSFSKGEGYCHC